MTIGLFYYMSFYPCVMYTDHPESIDVFQTFLCSVFRIAISYIELYLNFTIRVLFDRDRKVPWLFLYAKLFSLFPSEQLEGISWPSS